jgi:hypothetical protein
MNQLNEAGRSPDFHLDRADADGACLFQHTQPVDLAVTPEGQAPDEPFLLVSPPPLPWPRIFPQL